MSKVTLYGTNWCGDCVRTRRFLREHQIEYDFINIDRDPAAEQFVLQTNRGMRSVPTVLFADGSILVEPSDEQLGQKLNVP
jgi:glutaredoxin-like protein